MAPRTLAALVALLAAGCGARIGPGPGGSPGSGPGPDPGSGPGPAPGSGPQADPAAPAAIIYRDAYGAPHVVSDTDAGALFGMAWALADDDWPLMEENYLHALGRHAELVGEAGVAEDRLARALEIVPLSRAEYEAAPPRLRGLLDAFAAGANAWLAARPPGALRVLDRVEPWYPIALIRYKYYQVEFLGYAGLRPEWTRRLFDQGWPAPQAGDRPARVAPAAGEAPGPLAGGERPHGSNQWAVAPARTASGGTLLLINPHQRFVGVQRYAEIHLDSREGLRFSGLTVFGFPLPYMGHNGRLGWAYTDNYADHSDLYAVTLDDPAEPLRYRWGDGHRTTETWTETVRVRAAAGGLEERTFPFWKTHHGPVVGVADDGRPLAARLARLAEGGWYEQWEAMIRARSLPEWRAALARLRVAYMNVLYADAEGNIGYVYGSAVPRRKPGIDPAGILEGGDPATEWQGFHPLEELPQVWNPPSGWLLNTNSEPFSVTEGVPFTRADFPAYMVGPETDNPRAQSSRRVLRALDRAGFEDFARLAWDSRLSAADAVLPELFAEATGSEGALAAAVERLGAWDRTASAGSVETTWFVLMAELRAAAERGGEHPAHPWLAALGEALRRLEAEHGTAEVAWGAINRHQRPLPGAPLALDPARPSLPIGGAPGSLGSVFTYHSAPAGSAAPRLGTGGNSFLMAVELGPGRSLPPRARSILNYGQSGDPASPHVFDQATLYSRREMKPAPFTREEVEAAAVSRLEVGPDLPHQPAHR
jgi:acyl-homoserine-lactone acylase